MAFYLLFSLWMIAAGAAAADDAPPAYRQTECPFAVEIVTSAVPDFVAQCGRASLVENRTDGSGVVSVPVVSLGPAGAAPPAVILGGGGPGGGLSLERGDSILFWENFRRKTLGDGGRLILLDQRGAGLSRPLLNCPEEKPLVRALLAAPLPLPQERARWQAMLRDCRQRLLGEGVQVDAFTTAASADDIEDIRALLAINEWHLIGYSYATRLALDVIRRHPHGVAGAVLDSAVPNDAARLPPFYPLAAVISAISRACHAQQHCRRHGDPAGNIAAALQQAEAAPLTLTTALYGETHRIVLSPPRLLELLHIGIYADTGAAALPFFSRQLAAGNANTPNGEYFARLYLDFHLDEGWATLLNWHINCLESHPMPPPPTTTLQRRERAFFDEYHNVCAALWPRPDPPPPAPAPVQTDKPLLLLSGAYDPATPPDWADALARRLPNARQLTVPAAHTPSVRIPCLQDAMRSFFHRVSATIAANAAHCADERLTFY